MNLKELHKAIRGGIELTVEQKFVKQLELTIQQLEDEGKGQRSTNYKPSALTCPRQMFYYRNGVKADSLPSDYTAVGIAESGTDRHARLQAAISKMKECGYDCEYIDVEKFIAQFKPAGTRVVGKRGAETKCFNDIYDMSFMCDGIVRIGGNYYILEIKTESCFKFSSRFGVDEKHYAQGICYSLLFGLNNVIFLYENRDTCAKKAFMFTVTDKMRDEIKKRIEYVEECRKENKLPTKTSNQRVCQYCPYALKCKMEAVK